MFIEATYTDPVRMASVRGMCRNGTLIGCPAHNPATQYYVVDGKVWLVTDERVVLLGSYADFMDEVRKGIWLVEFAKHCS